MLMLMRRAGEAIMIGDNVKIVITEVNGNQVKVGVEAPREIAVHREEVYERIQAEASQGNTT